MWILFNIYFELVPTGSIKLQTIGQFRFKVASHINDSHYYNENHDMPTEVKNLMGECLQV